MNVIYKVINRTLSIKKELGLSHIFLEDDQAIYAKLLDVMFKLENENNKIFDKTIVCMGGFHIIICLICTIYSCFRNTGLVELLSRAGLGGKGTIQNSVKGDDVRYDIYPQKLLFEAITRSKIHHAIKTDEVFSEKIDKKQILMQSVIENISKQNSDELVQGEQFVELPQRKRDLANFFEHYIDMANLPLKMIHFQRTNNWEGYIKAIRKLLPYCFSCNRHNYTRNLSYYCIQMKNLASSYPSRQMFVKEEGFTVSLTGKPHSKIPMDQIIQMTIVHQKKPVV